MNQQNHQKFQLYPLKDFIMKLPITREKETNYFNRIQSYNSRLELYYTGKELAQKRQELSQRIENDLRNDNRKIHNPNKRIKLNLGDIGKQIFLEYMNRI